MTFRPKLTRLLPFTLVLLCFQPSLSQPKDARTTTIIRVGVITYSDYDKTYIDNEQKFTRLADLYNKPSSAKRTKISFQLAVGSYDDVLAWYKDGLIDVAILSAGPVGELLSTSGWEETVRDLYIATAPLAPLKPDNSLGVPERRRVKSHFRYHSVCVVSSSSGIKDWSQIRERMEEDARRIGADSKQKRTVDFFFVHPLSASGRILPEYVLHQWVKEYKKLKVDWLTKLAEQLELDLLAAKWTYDHDATIRALAQPTGTPVPGSGTSAGPKHIRVGFVWDVVGDDPKVRAMVHKITIPELDQLWIPQEVVLISPSFIAQKQLVKDVFVGKEDGRQTGYEAEDVSDWIGQYNNGIVKWVKDLNLEPSKMKGQFVSLRQMIDEVRSYENSHRGGARLALVLSGGGAKCAYQIGVIQAIENDIRSSNMEFSSSKKQEGQDKVESHHKQVNAQHASNGGPKTRPLDIGLVVGTSGGAINALSVALGLTRTDDGQDALKDVWLSFKQQDFFRPWSPLPVILGLIVGLGQALIIILALRLLDEERIEWRRFSRLSVALLAVMAIAIWFSSWRFWAWIPLIAIVILVEAQLKDRRTENWRTRAGLTLLVVGIMELIVGKAQVTPWKYMPYIISVLIFILLAFVTVLAIRVAIPHGANWRKVARVIIPVIAAIEVAILLIWKAPVRWMSQLYMHHMALHFWMAITMNLVFSAICLMVIAMLMLFAEWSATAAKETKNESLSESRLKGYASELANRNMDLFSSRRPILTGLAGALVVLFALQLGRTLFFDKSLLRSDGIDHVFADGLPKLLEHLPDHPDVRTLIAPQDKDDHARLKDISQIILEGRLLKRDLVITSSLLTNGDEEPDRYFYYSYRGPGSYQDPPPDKRFPVDRRFKSFEEGDLSPKMLDVVIGSATIYPVFNPRHLTMSQSPNKTDDSSDFDLIDGGFTHNSPIEAAVAWGATHIILIEASPKAKPSLHLNLLDNSVDAFNYLFSEAQLLDDRSRGKIEIFSIRPDGDDSGEYPNLCTFDFDAFFVNGAIEKGFNDALTDNPPKFLRERGHPIF